MPVAQRADTCLMCGAVLKERTRKPLRLPHIEGDLWVPLLIVAALAFLWFWKPWQADEPQAMAPASDTATPTATPLPSPTYVVVPTATPLRSPTPPPTATLPPNQTIHVVESGEVVTTIAKNYGTTAAAILAANGLKANSILSVGQQLVIPLPPADTPTPTVTPTPSPTPFEYVIRANDTLSEIARRFDTTVEALMEANNIADASRLRIGVKLLIVRPPDFQATMAYQTHEVQAGETLIGIATKYGRTVAEVREASGLTGNNIRPGQELRIPVGTATPTPTLTQPPTLTPTPGPPYEEPLLLAPPNGAAFEGGTETAILLSWASLGILEDDEWYVLHVQRERRRDEPPSLIWTKATSWRVPADLYPGAGSESPQFRWWVVVMRETGLDATGARAGEAISPPTSTRAFTWK